MGQEYFVTPETRWDLDREKGGGREGGGLLLGSGPKDGVNHRKCVQGPTPPGTTIFPEDLSGSQVAPLVVVCVFGVRRLPGPETQLTVLR